MRKIFFLYNKQHARAYCKKFRYHQEELSTFKYSSSQWLGRRQQLDPSSAVQSNAMNTAKKYLHRYLANVGIRLGSEIDTPSLFLVNANTVFASRLMYSFVWLY